MSIIPDMLFRKKMALAGSAIVLGGLLIFAGIKTGTKFYVFSQFDSGGYAYLYHGGPSTVGHFVSHPFEEHERSSLAGYVLQATISASDTTEEKIAKLAKFILDRIDESRGVPDRSWYQEGPFEQFELVWNKQLSGIYCSQFRHVYTSLANQAGIPTRVVHSKVTTGPNTRQTERRKGVSGHNFSESYIAETDEWAIVDLHSRLALIRDADGSFVNTIDLYDLLMGNKRGGGFTLVHYDSATRSVRQEHLDSTDALTGFFSEHTPYSLFFHDNQIFNYERNGRDYFFYRPYLAPKRDVFTRKRFVALSGAGALLVIFGFVYFARSRRHVVT